MIHIYSGVPGSGKTTALLGDFIKVIENHGIGGILFLSFTRSVRKEIWERMVALGYEEDDIRSVVRTLHSFCFSSLGLSRDNVMSADDYEEFNRQYHYNIAMRESWGEDTFSEELEEGESFGNILLRTIHLLYQMRKDLTAWKSIAHQIPDEYYQHISLEVLQAFEVDYSAFKKKLGKYDYIDFIMKFRDNGQYPTFDFLFIDEVQDFNPLELQVIDGLKEKAGQAWLAGDAKQSIMNFKGASPEWFEALIEDNRTRVVELNFSHRLPKDIVVHAMYTIKKQKGFHRIQEIETNLQGGVVRQIPGSIEYLVGDLGRHYNTEWKYFIVSRVRYRLGEVKKHLSESFLPYGIIGRGQSIFNASMESTMRLLRDIVSGNFGMSGKQVGLLLRDIPQKDNLKRGWKTDIVEKNSISMEEFYGGFVRVKNAQDFIGLFISCLNSKEKRAAYLSWIQKGYPAFNSSKINVFLGTWHGCKGLECDCVYSIPEITRRIARSMQEPDGYNSEVRLQYVVDTRARHELVIVGSEYI